MKGRAIDASRRDVRERATDIRRLALALVRDSDAADDVAQETWLAWLRRPPVHADATRSWTYRVVRNFVRLRSRSSERLDRRHEAAARERSPQCQDLSPETLAVQAELRRVLTEAVFALDEPFRSTVVLRFFEGLSSAEIARAKKIPPGTVRGRLKEGLDRIRAALDERHDGDRRPWYAALIPFGRRPLRAGLALKTGVFALLVAGVWHARQKPETAATTTASLAPRPPLRLTLQPTPAGAALAGVVRDADGRLVSGAVVHALAAGELSPERQLASARRTRTTAAGFRLGELPAGRYTLSASAPGWTGALLEGVAVGDGQVVAGIELRLARGGATVAGRVSDAGGGPLAGARVAAVTYDGADAPTAHPVFETTTDGDGRYHLRLPPGDYTLLGDADGYLVGHQDRRVDGDARNDFNLSPAARVRGRVLAAGAPAAGATVWLGGGKSVRAGDDGVFELDRVEAGEYRLAARLGALARELPAKLAVPSGARLEGLVVELERAPAVSGRLLGDGGSLAGATVELRPMRGGPRVEARLEPAGRYRAEGLLPGRYRLLARAEGHATVRRSIVVYAQEGEQQLDVSLERAATLTGRVVDAMGAPVPAAAIAIEPEGSRRGRSGPDGRFRSGGLTPGRVVVRAQVGGLLSARREVVLAAGGAEDVQLVVGGGWFVTGRVRWDDGAAAVGVEVVGLPAGGGQESAATAADGTFRLGPLSAGEVSVVALLPTTSPRGLFPDQLRDMAQEGARRHTRETIRRTLDGALDGIELVLPRARWELSGVVVDAAGAPLAGAVISAEPEETLAWRVEYAVREDVYTALSGADGRFAIAGLPRGNLRLQAEYPGLRRARVEVASPETPVRVQLAR